MEQTESNEFITIEVDPKQINNVRYCLGRVRGVIGIVEDVTDGKADA